MEANSNEVIEKDAICGNRFGLIKGFLRYVKEGERRIEDVAKVGPASVEKCTLAVEEWDRVVKARETTGQCKGIFFSTFGQRHMFRRCEAAAKELCSLCKSMREIARKEGIGTVSIEGQDEYEVVNKALFTRAGVVSAMTYWEKQSEKIKTEGKVHKLYPFFTAQQVVQLLMMTTGVIFENGGKGGRVYKRSRIVVEAQDRYVKECMGYMLQILCKEKKKQFEQRFARVVKIAKLIHGEMIVANVGSEMPEVGAVQTSDVVREELCRAAKWTAKGTRAPKFLSNNVTQLSDWAKKRRMSAGTETKSEMESSVHSPSTSPPASVSSSPTSPPKRVRTPAKALRPRKPLVMHKVGGDAVAGGKASEDDERDDKGTQEVGVPVFKKFEIRTSTIPGAGDGLFLTESAVHDEAIARYSGILMSKEQARASKSKYKVKISEDQYLCAGRDEDWEGQKANCARKAKRKCNARFAANNRCNFCEKTGKHWIKIFAVGSIEPQDEVLPDYGDEYWSEEEGEEKTPLPPPKSNKKATSSSGDEGGDSDSSWKPSPMVESEGRGKRRLSSRSAGATSSTKEHDDSSSRRPFRRKIYAVTVGRCVGLFRSTVRMQSSVFKYHDQSFGKFMSEVEAKDYMIGNGIDEPKRFWLSSYESGTLVSDPESVLGQDVYFPVGKGMYDEDVRHGVVTESMILEDRRMWKVQMDDGLIDRMSEWPLLCGLALAEERRANVSSGEEMQTESGRARAATQEIQFFAVRGTSDDGIVHCISDVFPRLEGAHAEYERFDSRSQAQAWIEERRFFAVKFSDSSVKVVKEVDIVEATRGKKGVQVKGPSTRKIAAEMVRTWEMEKEKREREVFVRRPSSKGKSGCFARLKNGNRCGRLEGLRETQLGPMCRRHALLCKSESENEDDAEEGCIARLKNGDTCGHSKNLRDTKLGPMCQKHAAMCKSESGEEEENGPEHFAEAEEVHYTKRKRVKAAPASEEVVDVTSEDSAERGVKLPEMIESLKKDRKGMYAVVAVRTYLDEECPEEPAGSVWLSSDKAARANVRNGSMRIFNDAKDIFENISLAHEWIKDQLVVSSSTDLEGEADKRWKEAQERMQKRKDDGKEKRKSVKSEGSKSNRRSKGRGGRGASRGSGGAGKANRSKGRGAGRGAGRGSRKGSRNDGAGDRRKKKPERDESDEGSSAHESIDTDEDVNDAGPSSGGRRFRKSRRRGRIRGGLRSGAMKMLDKKQKRVENQLFGEEGGEVVIYEFDVPDVKLVQKIPLPGKARAFTPSKDADTANHVITFGNDMKAELAEKHYKSFEAFSFAELMEFKETVEYVASYQPEEKKRVTESVVEAVQVIARNATHLYSTMRDSDTMGNYGENFKAYTYVQIMYLVMFREAFDNSLAEMFFMNYAPKFATMARGCPGMAPFKDVREATAATKASAKDRCLVCGKPGHRADSDVHKAELAEGSRSMSPEQLRSALAYIASDATLNAEQKRSWSARIKAFWAKLKEDSRQEDSL